MCGSCLSYVEDHLCAAAAAAVYRVLVENRRNPLKILFVLAARVLHYRATFYALFMYSQLNHVSRLASRAATMDLLLLQAGKGEGGVGLWEELLPGREAWLERGPCMGRGRLPAVLSEERLASALLWRTETAEMEKVRCAVGNAHDTLRFWGPGGAGRGGQGQASPCLRWSLTAV